MEAGRRSVVRWLAATSGVALSAGCAGSEPVGPDVEGGPGADAGPVSGSSRQPGVATPVPRQRHLVLCVLDLAPAASARRVLAGLGEAVRALPDIDGLTVTVGVGPGLVAAARGPASVGAADLPVFAREEIADTERGGDLLLQVCADLQRTVSATTEQLVTALAGDAVPRWRARGFRGDVDGRGARNLLGFYDGVEVPTAPADLDEAVWTAASDGLADATVCVVRRMRLDTAGFRRRPVAEQEAVIGRRRADGAPLSGGSIDDAVDLRAKSGAGVYDVPVDAHVRRAHPFTGGAQRLMLRRSYSFDDGAQDRGLLFVSFQRELAMFVDTQHAMDQGDALMAFATTTASGTWLVLPWDRSAPLGAVLYS